MGPRKAQAAEAISILGTHPKAKEMLAEYDFIFVCFSSIATIRYSIFKKNTTSRDSEIGLFLQTDRRNEVSNPLSING